MHTNENKNAATAGLSCWSPRFLISAIILVLTATGLRPAMRALADHYQKLPIAIRLPLKDLDISRMPSFRRGWEISRLSASVKDMGTSEYTIVRFANRNPDDGLIGADLFITYYNDPQDKVPHTPDVCARQGGAVVRKMSTVTIETPELGPEHPQIEARLLVLRKPKYNIITIYFFCVEAQFRYTRDTVRWIITKPGNRYVYFSKIEASAYYPIGADAVQDRAIEMCKTLLREAMPILLTDHFPDKNQLKHR